MNIQKLAVIRQRQSLDLEAKIQMTKKRIREWYEHFDGDVYVAFSGGKDSTVLLDLVWSIYPDVPAVFSNTGLELRDIKDFVRDTAKRGLTSIVNGRRVWRKGEVVQVRPVKNFKQVIEEDGFALVGKKQSKAIRVLQGGKTEKNKNMFKLYDEGVNSKGQLSPRWKLANKWRFLINEDIKISEKCCDHLKKNPTKKYAKETGRKSMTGVMAEEGGFRGAIESCNGFDQREPNSAPMLFWLEKDVIQYIETRKLKISKAYRWQKNEFGVLVEPETRTGCAFCMFGVHLEKGVNRFQKLYHRDRRMWDTAINKLGLKKPLDLIDVKYIPDDVEVSHAN
ncbi:phosphoadenosine phosphosulfate reductase family protein [Pseudoalteromonas aurantia]|uniref:Phosphoadenosine phosphosulfate reductase n=1 Tax=Pseudoalteromonas aurantia TaxID=43654 RepID=A0ABY2VYW7_9GAMM|nr:phosphoadenosine phosphosulfate reductase family protein [Pseudoalteromonas aurantia]TMO75318.1 phosphoadenosine phosphosulfate reductase [Pseudoalteromonas aurantia]